MITLGVVPIFVSTGAAVLPTIIAAATGVLAVLFKPRELLRLCRQRPGIALATVTGIAAIVGIIAWEILTPASAQLAGRPTNSTIRPAIHYDWAKVAEDILAQQRLHQSSQTAAQSADSAFPGAIAAAPGTATAHPADPSPPAIEPRRFAQDFSRSLYTSGSSPTKLGALWRFRPEETVFLGEPVIADHRIYVAGCQSDLGGYTGLLACIDSETGKPIWQITELKGDVLKPFFSSPALSPDGKSLLIGQGLHEDRNCSLLCFDTANGQLRWSIQTPLHIESSPAIQGDLVVVGAGAVEGKDGRASGNPGFVLAARISDGKELWRQPVNDPESSPAIDSDGIIYIGSGFNGTAIVAMRSDTDEQLHEKGLARIVWNTPVSQPMTGPITLAGDVIIAGGGNSDMVHSNRDAKGVVIAMDRKTGQIRWQTPFADAVLGGIAFRDGLLICPVRTGEVCALSVADGKMLWHTKISGDAPVLAGCAFTGKRIYAVSNDGYLAILDPAAGKIIEKIPLNDQAKPGTGLSLGSPQVGGGRVLVGSETGGLHCLIGAGGEQ